MLQMKAFSGQSVWSASPRHMSQEHQALSDAVAHVWRLQRFEADRIARLACDALPVTIDTLSCAFRECGDPRMRKELLMVLLAIMHSADSEIFGALGQCGQP